MGKYERLKNLREDNDMTQADIAAILGISQRAYAYYESGDRAIPLDILVKYADHFNVSTDYLLDRTQDPKFRKKD